MYSNASLQAFSNLSGVYLSTNFRQTHAGHISLLLHFVAAENGIDNTLRVAAHFSGPVNKTLSVPMDILLVVGRHMVLNGAVLVESSVQPGVGTDLVSGVEHLYRGSGELYIHLLLDVLKGDGVIHALHRNVVIGSDSCHLFGR